MNFIFVQVKTRRYTTIKVLLQMAAVWKRAQTQHCLVEWAIWKLILWLQRIPGPSLSLFSLIIPLYVNLKSSSACSLSGILSVDTLSSRERPKLHLLVCGFLLRCRRLQEPSILWQHTWLANWRLLFLPYFRGVKHYLNSKSNHLFQLNHQKALSNVIYTKIESWLPQKLVSNLQKTLHYNQLQKRWRFSIRLYFFVSLLPQNFVIYKSILKQTFNCRLRDTLIVSFSLTNSSFT